MERLSADNLARVMGLFRGLDDHLALVAILEGFVAAPVYIDDSDRRRYAFAWVQHRAFVGGEIADDNAIGDLHALLSEEIWPAVSSNGAGVLVFHFPLGPWEGRLQQTLAPYRPERFERHYYALRDTRCRPAPLPDGYRLREVDEALLANHTLAGRDALMEEMLSERPSVEAFFEKSFGICSVCDDRIVGWCLSEYNTRRRCEVGIGVAEGHRRRGIATAMMARFVEMARQRGLACIGWHCWAGNTASKATALRAGLTLERRYPVYVAFYGQSD